MDLAERHPGALALNHQRGHLIGLHGEGRVHPAIGARERKMLLDHAGAECHAGHAGPDAEGVVRQSDLTIEHGAQMRNSQEIRVGWRRRVGAGAFQQNQVAAAGRARGAHCLIQLGDRSHAGGDDEGLARGSRLSDQGQVCVFE